MHPTITPVSPYILNFHFAGVQLHIFLLLEHSVNYGTQDAM